MGEFSITHLLLLAFIFLIFFGPSKLPQLGQSLGKAIRGFKQGLNEIEVEAKEVKDVPHSQQNPQQNQAQSQQITGQQNQSSSQQQPQQQQSVHQYSDDPSKKS